MIYLLHEAAPEELSEFQLPLQIHKSLFKQGIDSELVCYEGPRSLSLVHKGRVISFSTSANVEAVRAKRFFHAESWVQVFLDNWGKFLPMDAAQFLLSFWYNGKPTAHWNVPHSVHTADSMTAFAKKHLAPSLAREVLSRMRLITCGVESDFYIGECDPDLLVVPFNRYNNQYKQVDLHAEVTATYHTLRAKKGKPAQTLFYYSKEYKPNAALEKGGLPYEAIPQPKTREEFYHNAARAGMFLSTSKSESFGLYYLELLVAGTVGVFLDKPWVRTLLPGYPYIAPASELVAMMDYVRENYGQCHQEVVDQWAPFIRARYCNDRFSRELANLAMEGKDA